MIKRVRRQFIAITMTMLTAVLLIPLIALNVIIQMVTYDQTYDNLKQIASSEAATWEEENNMPDDLPAFHANDKDDDMNADEDTEESKTEAKTETTAASETTRKTEKTDENHIKRTDTVPADNGIQDPLPEKEESVPETEPTAETMPKQTDVPQETKPATDKQDAETDVHTKETTITIKAPETTDSAVFPLTTQLPKSDEQDRPEEQENGNQPMQNDTPSDSATFVLLAQTHSTETTAVTSAAAENEEITTTITAASKNSTTTTTTRKNNAPGKPDDSHSNSSTINHFTCYMDKDGVLVELDGTDEYTEYEAQLILDEILSSGKTDGYYGNLQYYWKELHSGMMIVFTDCASVQVLLKNILFISITMFLIMEIFIFLLSLYLTKRSMRPIYATFERQRQFISDAGHELKTPLTIISANVDILEDEIGDNKWLSYIRLQTERMRVLVGDMMNLTKLEMNDAQKNFKQFSLSSAISSAALPFESQAFESQKKLELDIQENILYTGDVEQIKRLVGIFIDNAIKYSDEKGEIRISLHQIKDKRVLKFYNTGKGVAEDEKEKIFERFYRSDASRNRSTGGYGLGLSIAKSICDTHKIKIHVEYEYGKWICFILNF